MRSFAGPVVVVQLTIQVLPELFGYNAGDARGVLADIVILQDRTVARAKAHEPGMTKSNQSPPKFETILRPRC